jgi:hypothetical protein
MPEREQGAAATEEKTAAAAPVKTAFTDAQIDDLHEKTSPRARAEAGINDRHIDEIQAWEMIHAGLTILKNARAAAAKK